MCTIKDFVNYCNKKNIKINNKNLNYKNLFSQLGIFVIEKQNESRNNKVS